MFIDVHCHLDICENIEDVVKDAKEKRVLIVSAGIDGKTNRKTLDLAKKLGIKSCLGVYPINALELGDKELNEEIKFIEKNKDDLIGVGEVGMDFKESEERKKQEGNFKKFIELSIKLNKPIIVHSRKAELECIEVLEKMKAKRVLMHCFSGKMSLVKRIVDNGWYLSIPANVKFSEHFQSVVRDTDIKQILCETDSPYLHPEKKWPNNPGNVIESYKKIAEIKNLSLKDVEKQVEDNFNRLFGS